MFGHEDGQRRRVRLVQSSPSEHRQFHDWQFVFLNCSRRLFFGRLGANRGGVDESKEKTPRSRVAFQLRWRI
jgi:hypothetical protein